MKINQVEELVGITKKNIRFYEEQGLVSPGRDPSNGYREYSLADVDRLTKIRLLRQLDIPCEEIRKVIEGVTSLDRCLEDHMVRLDHRSRDLLRMKEMCTIISEGAGTFEEMKAGEYLEQMKALEKGGVHFMDVEKSDVSVRRKGSLLSAVVMIGVMLAVIVLLLWAQSVDPLPLWGFAFILLAPVVVVVGILIALHQRMKELERSELDEAGKY